MPDQQPTVGRVTFPPMTPEQFYEQDERWRRDTTARLETERYLASHRQVIPNRRFDPATSYKVGDTFVYEGYVCKVTATHP